MRVLHLDLAREWRGGQVQLALLLRHARHEAHVAALDGSPVAAGVADVAPVHRLGADRWRAILPLQRLIRALRPDLVAAHTPHAHTAAWLAGAPRVVVHRRVDFPLSRGIGARARNHRVSRWIAVSEAVRAELIGAGVAADRAEVVHDGVDATRFNRHHLGGGGWGALGALVPHKAHADLLDAIALAGGPPGEIAGDGPLRASLEARARALGLGDVVRFVGAIDDVPGWLARRDLLVHPSREEGLGQAVLEAFCAGVPVVATQAGGLAELVLPGVLGLAVPPRSPRHLAAAIREALDAPDAARARAERARAQVRAVWSADAMAGRTDRVYDRAMGGSG